jgi:hypothetical protein
VEHLPLLEVQRELYALPRGSSRFREYLARMTAGSGEIALPLVAMNPMAKEHVGAAIAALLALGAEEVARAAIAEVAPRVPEMALRVGLVVADERGGWTNRYTTDFGHRFEQRAMLERGFAVALLWAGDAPSAATVRREVIFSIARAAWQTAHGAPRTLREMLTQENEARRLAGLEARLLPDSGEHLDARDAPTLFAMLYGDEAAVSLGYRPLGTTPAL